MSDRGPSNPLGDRPRMAEALASLKEGLRDTADPLYDGWRLRARANASNAGSSEASAPEKAGTSESSSPNQVDAADTIEITFDATPDQTEPLQVPPPKSDETPRPAAPFLTVEEAFFAAEPAMGEDESEQEDESDHGSRGREASPDASVAKTAMPGERAMPAGAASKPRRVSVQTDTVRVRVIRYPTFPRWALIVAAALLVFSGSSVALRIGFPKQHADSGEHVPHRDSVAGATLQRDDPSAEREATSAHAEMPPVEARTPSPTTTHSVGYEPASEIAPTSDHAAPTVQLPPSPGKMAPTPSRSRAGTHDFFRDPGF